MSMDVHSLRFKLWCYFALFALLLVCLVWFLQIFLLNYSYEDMKIEETKRVASGIVASYGSDTFIDSMNTLVGATDIYVHIESPDGSTVIYSPQNEENRRPIYAYVSEMLAIKEQLMSSGQAEVSKVFPEKNSNANVLAYAGKISSSNGEQAILYIFSPLYPVKSTVSILRNQLLYVAIVAVVLACVLSLYLSMRIVKPIRTIDEKAKELARGKYGIVFQGGHYTEIINLADTLTYTSLQLEKADGMQKDLFANVSHDIRTPLTMIRSYAEMVRDISGDDPEKRNAHLQVIIDESDRLNRLVDDMMTLSRMQTNAIVLDRKSFDICEAARSVLASYMILVENDGYRIEFDGPQSLLVSGDEERIKQVISNLMTNAVKYCGEDKYVRLSVKALKGVVRLSVDDHGPGIAPEELPNIWDRYYKASANHVREVSGTGLGLSIVKEILTLHNARYGVNSMLGEGSTFWFELPLIKIRR